MKKALRAGVFAAIALTSAAAAYADDEAGPFTGGITLTSDYRFRGQSQSDRDAALQGWLQYDHKSGFYANVWASSIDFNDGGAITTDDSNLEVDLTVGYNHTFNDKLTGGVKAVYYWYADADYLPGSNEYDYLELIANLGYDFGVAAISGELAWSPDYFGESSDAVSLKGGVSVPLMEQFAFMGALSASGNIGYQWIDDNATYGTPDYLYYDLGLSAEWEIFVFDVRWVGTDLNKLQCYGGTDLCEDGVMLSVTANLPG